MARDNPGRDPHHDQERKRNAWKRRATIGVSTRTRMMMECPRFQYQGL